MSERMLAKRRKRRLQKKRWRLIQSIIFITILTLSIFMLLKSSFFNIKTVTAQGQSKLKTSEVTKLAGIGKGENIFKVNLEEARKRLLLNPRVKEVELKRKYPAEVVIQVKERKPLALIPAKEGFVEIDEEGTLLSSVEKVSKLVLPIITGHNLHKQTLGSKEDSRNIKTAIIFLKAMPERLFKEISEINVSNPHQVVVYTATSIQIRLGSPEGLGEKMSMLETVLKTKTSKDIEYIDISYNGQPVFKIKGDYSEKALEDSETAAEKLEYHAQD